MICIYHICHIYRIYHRIYIICIYASLIVPDIENKVINGCKQNEQTSKTNFSCENI